MPERQQQTPSQGEDPLGPFRGLADCRHGSSLLVHDCIDADHKLSQSSSQTKLTLAAGERVRRRGAGLLRASDLLLSRSLGGERRLRGGERGMRDLRGDNGLRALDTCHHNMQTASIRDRMSCF